MARYKSFSTTPMADYSRRRQKARSKNSVFGSPKKRKKSGCYIATCVYGSYDCSPVWVLRRFRDQTLENSWPGRAFISFYYSVSPLIIKVFGQSKTFRRLVKYPLDRFVDRLLSNGYIDAPYHDPN